MKRFIVLALVGLIFFVSCGNEFYTIQRKFSRDDLESISPKGLIYKESAGLNWWTGTYNDKPVLIHAVITQSYANVDITFIH